MREGKGIALLPIGVFLVLYLGLGILFEYVMEIPMGFTMCQSSSHFLRRFWWLVCRIER